MKILKVYEANGTPHDVMVDDDMFAELDSYNWIWRDGYAVRKLSHGKYYQLHRQVGGAAFKEQIIIDHIDGDHHNNQKANLRRADRFQNQQNRKTNEGNTLPKGIRRLPNGKYNCRVQGWNKRHVFGAYNTIEEAVEARNEFAAKLHGEFMRPAHLIEEVNEATA